MYKKERSMIWRNTKMRIWSQLWHILCFACWLIISTSVSISLCKLNHWLSNWTTMMTWMVLLCSNKTCVLIKEIIKLGILMQILCILAVLLALHHLLIWILFSKILLVWSLLIWCVRIQILWSLVSSCVWWVTC